MVTAPAGYVITSIDYTEGGNGATQNGIATASGSVVVDNMPTNFQLAPPIGPNDAREWGITLDTILVDNKQSVAVSITNSLFSYAFDGSQAFIEKNDSTLTVGLTAVPLPAAAWLFGSALIALVGIQRRKAA